jgi:hypothetical protein
MRWSSTATVPEVNAMEIAFLKLLDFNVYISTATFEAHRRQLMRLVDKKQWDHLKPTAGS